MLPLAVLLVCFLFEVGKEVASHLLLVEEVVAFVDNTLVAMTTEGFCLFTHTVVIIPLALVLRFGIDVDAERFMAHDLHRRFVRRFCRCEHTLLRTGAPTAHAPPAAEHSECHPNDIRCADVSRLVRVHQYARCRRRGDRGDELCDTGLAHHSLHSPWRGHTQRIFPQDDTGMKTQNSAIHAIPSSSNQTN